MQRAVPMLRRPPEVSSVCKFLIIDLSVHATTPKLEPEVASTSHARNQCGWPGPKSGLRLLLFFMQNITPTGGVRVPVPAGTGGPKLTGHVCPRVVGKHAPCTTAPVSGAVRVMEATGFKRSFRGAQRRCAQHQQNHTIYKGKQTPGSQLGLHSARSDHISTGPRRRPACRRRGGQAQRLKILSVNVNSLGGFLWSEVKIFLSGEGLQYDFVFLQETHRTASSTFQIDRWTAVARPPSEEKESSRWLTRNMMPPRSDTRKSYPAESSESKFVGQTLR